MNVSCKQLKASLVPEVKKLGSVFLALKLGEFLLFDDFFLDLADFQNLDNFLLFKFLDFLAYSIPSLSTPTLLSPLSIFNILKVKLSNA